jgi:hypothetical protein
MIIPKRRILLITLIACAGFIEVCLIEDFLSTTLAKQVERVPDLDKAIEEIKDTKKLATRRETGLELDQTLKTLGQANDLLKKRDYKSAYVRIRGARASLSSTLTRARERNESQGLISSLESNIVLLNNISEEVGRIRIGYEIIAPDLAAQGEVFTGLVVAETPSGYEPLDQGDEVVLNGQVVEVEPGGEIPVEGLTSVIGNSWIDVNFPGVPTETESHHVTVVPVSDKVTTEIKHASEIVTTETIIHVEGQGLDSLTSYALVDEGGRQFKLEESAGSSLQKVFLPPDNLPKGSYRLVGRDSRGKQFQAPNTCVNPRITVSGPPITHRGQRGNITVNSDADVLVELLGGEPQISLDQHMVKVDGGVPNNVGFTANEVGPYTVIAMGMNPEDVPVEADALRVNTETGVIETTYNRATNETGVKVPVKVTDTRGNPVRNVPLDVAISTKSGVEYIEVSTNRSGIGLIETSFKGQHEASSISAQVYRVPGYAWKQDFPKCKCNPIKKTLVYSRGNNDDKQLKDYFKKTTEKAKKDPSIKPSYVYETGKLEFYFTGDPSKQCLCKANKCEGKFDLNLEMRILNLTEQPDIADPRDFKLLDGVDAGGTEQKGGGKPAPNVTTKTDKVKYPAGGEVIKQPDPKKRDYKAKAKAEVPCKPGTYKKRFYIVPRAVAGTTGTPSGLIAYVDAIIKVEEVKGDEPCVLTIEVKGYWLEYNPDWPWLPAAAPELPEVEYDMENPGGGRKKGKTRNISKLVEEDGKKIDDPYPPK